MTELTISYLILAHESTQRVIRLADKLLKEDSTGQVIIHFDKKSGRTPYQILKKHYAINTRCHVLANRIRCGWGQWSLVKATLNMLRYARENQKTDYYYLLSEFCYPTQPIDNLKEYLSKRYGINFIECEDSSWIKDGIREDRYLYRHFLNKRKYSNLHRWMYKLQKFIGLKRKIPEGLNIQFGSQWWCLTDDVVHHAFSFLEQYGFFFRWVWIPDECFFNSSVKKGDFRTDKPLTYYAFKENGEACLYEHIFEAEGKYFLRKYTVD